MKKILAMVIFVSMLFSFLPTVMAEEGGTDFAQKLEALYTDPDREYASDVRWWLGDAGYTDEVLLNEIQNLYDFGFHGVELCMQDGDAPNSVYAYGSEMWSHKWKLMMNAAAPLGIIIPRIKPSGRFLP